MGEYLDSILEKYGTPMYYFNEDYIGDRIKYLRDRLPAGTNICYAMKANTFLTGVAAAAADRIEVCSLGEFMVADSVGADYTKLVISGVYKSREMMEIIFDKVLDKPIYTAESISQYRLLKSMAKEKNIRIRLLLRLSSNNQFGMKKADIRQVIEENLDADFMQQVDIVGIHYFSGTQKHSLKLIHKELLKLKEFMEEVEKDYGIELSELEYGGGFPVYYFEGEEFDEDSFLAEFTDDYNELGMTKKLTIELGRSIAAGAGVYQTRIVDMKSDRYVNYCILDGGINHISYYGQTMGMKLPHIRHIKGTAYDTGEEKNYVLCGSLCTVNDILVKDILLKDACIDDRLVFEKAGAYCVTEGISLFLTRELPGVVLYSEKDRKAELVRDITQTYELNGPIR